MVISPSECSKNFKVIKSNLNILINSLNCIYGLELKNKNEQHYIGYDQKHKKFGTVEKLDIN